MKDLIKAGVLLLGLLLAMPAMTKVEALMFDTPEQEAIYKSLIAELRCLVCQNQNIADSNAELAQDLRGKTYELIKQGKSETEIIDYMVQRYGDFVMYRPPLKSTTLVLWVAPFIFMLVAVIAALMFIRKRRNLVPQENKHERLDEARELLERDNK